MDILTSLVSPAEQFNVLFYTGIAILAILILLLIPLRWQSAMTVPFSFRTFGIRKIRRWHSRTDTLANLMLWISVIFCILAPWIPYAPIIYLVWLIFTWLAAVSRAIRLSKVKSRPVRLTVIFMVDLVAAIGLLSTMGFYNNFVLWIRAFLFGNDVITKEAWELMYYLSSPNPAFYLIQTILLILPLASLWGQFKYMRLENTFKAANLTTYCIKNVFLCLVMAVFAIFSPGVIERIYNQDPSAQVQVENGSYPLEMEDAVKLYENCTQKIEQEKQQQEEQNAADQSEQPAAQPAVDPNAPAEQANPEEAPAAPEEAPVEYPEENPEAIGV